MVVGQVAREVVGAEHGHDAMGLWRTNALAPGMGFPPCRCASSWARMEMAILPCMAATSVRVSTGGLPVSRAMVRASASCARRAGRHSGARWQGALQGQIGPMVEGRAGRLDGRIHLGLACRLTPPDHLVLAGSMDSNGLPSPASHWPSINWTKDIINSLPVGTQAASAACLNAVLRAGQSRSTTRTMSPFSTLRAAAILGGMMASCLSRSTRMLP